MSNDPLVVDPQMTSLLAAEEERQARRIGLIASENRISDRVRVCLGSVLSNKYAEGRPGNRYYGGCEIVDEIEKLCESRVLEAFGLSAEEWGVNCQPLSGTPANLAAYLALLNPGDSILGMDLSCGGHLTHGYVPASGRHITGVSKIFKTSTYKTNPTTDLLDLDIIESAIIENKPDLVVAGASAYPREIDFNAIGNLAAKHGAKFMADISHISAFVAAGTHQSPFTCSATSAVMTTTHKTLGGPRGALLFFRKNLAKSFHEAVFPGVQGGPHLATIAAITTHMLDVLSPSFKEDYVAKIHQFTRSMCTIFSNNSVKMVTDGSDNHIIVIDTGSAGFLGKVFEAELLKSNIECSVSCVPGDKSPMNPGGVRIGIQGLVRRGVDADFIDQLANKIASTYNKLKVN